MSEECLVCWRVKDLPIPRPGSVRERYCDKCGEEVWLRPENATLQMKLYCRPCGAELTAEHAKKEPVVFMPAQLAHILSKRGYTFLGRKDQGRDSKTTLDTG